ncbi:o-succinylbenzoate synthase [Prochlorococcus marinus]|uniref:o-succinylbenzoate synthase n=1 Tax=Prochlorococcus marinus TaxID=1219 RepID=UPI0022B45562|nr:o-succinylbenzoate synthase [Prochlorococcus marinus]
MNLQLKSKPFSFPLTKPLQTSTGVIKEKKGWLIKLRNDRGRIGWGEISPLQISELQICARIINNLSTTTSREALEKKIKTWPGSLGFAIGAALAEIDGLIGSESKQNWLKVSSSALLLPTDKSLILSTLDSFLEKNQLLQKSLTYKWKVTNSSNNFNINLVKQILFRIPKNSLLRIDANGSWNRKQAKDWADLLHNEPKLEWLEQPLPFNDIEGLQELANQIPVALDESLILYPSLRKTWKNWQVRRPLLEGDPRDLLAELSTKNSYKTISTCFETGIGRRWVEHFAALQQKGATPTQPGLAPGWCPNGPLFSYNPQLVWDAA